MTRTNRALAAIVAAAAIAGSAATSAYAAETIKLTFISGYPPVSPYVAAFGDQFVKEVDAALAKTGTYKIEWNLAHSGQVVKPRGELEGVGSGLGDITPVTLGFYADKLPLYTIPYVTPFTSSDPSVMAANYIHLQEKFPQFAEGWAKFNQVQISTSTNVDNYVIISKAPIKTLADLKGKKIGGGGLALIWTAPTGAASVQSALPDFYNALNTGIVEGVIGWKHAMGAFKLCEPAPYMLDAGIGAAGMLALNVNMDVWKKLPKEVSVAMLAAAPGWNDLQNKLLVDGAAEQLERCKTQYKTVVTEMSDAERKAWAKDMPPLALDWSKTTEQLGLPARAILTAYMDYMRAAKQPVTRDWDKQ